MGAKRIDLPAAAWGATPASMRKVLYELLPDDVGAYCPDIPDAISLRDLAHEHAEEAQYRLTVDEAFAKLVTAFWRREFGGTVFTLERFGVQSREELDAESWPPDTLARRAVFWTAPEYAAFLARFWRLYDHDLPELGSDEGRLRWLAALPLDQYPPAVLTLVARLHVSHAIAGQQGHARPPRQRSFWPEIHARTLRWLDDEGEPDRLATIERFIAEQLARNDWHAADSTVRRHANTCRQEHRSRRRGR